jgi:hypothetical protein
MACGVLSKVTFGIWLTASASLINRAIEMETVYLNPVTIEEAGFILAQVRQEFNLFIQQEDDEHWGSARIVPEGDYVLDINIYREWDGLDEESSLPEPKACLNGLYVDDYGNNLQDDQRILFVSLGEDMTADLLMEGINKTFTLTPYEGRG